MVQFFTYKSAVKLHKYSNSFTKTFKYGLILSTILGINLINAQGNFFIAGGVGLVQSTLKGFSVDYIPKTLQYNQIENDFKIKNKPQVKISAGYQFTNFGVALDYNLTPYAKTKQNVHKQIRQQAFFVTPYTHYSAGIGRVFIKAGVGISYSNQRIKNPDQFYRKFENLVSTKPFRVEIKADETVDFTITTYNVVRGLAFKLGTGYEIAVNKASSIALEYEYISQEGIKETWKMQRRGFNIKIYFNGNYGGNQREVPIKPVYKVQEKHRQITHAVNLMYKYKFGA